VPLQSVSPLEHVLLLSHLPALQVSPVAQAVPHEPQFLSSVWVSVHVPLQSVSPLEHVLLLSHLPALQVSPVAQAVPHEPQFLSSALVLVHVPLQSTSPVAQALGSSAGSFSVGPASASFFSSVAFSAAFSVAICSVLFPSPLLLLSPQLNRNAENTIESADSKGTHRFEVFFFIIILQKKQKSFYASFRYTRYILVRYTFFSFFAGRLSGSTSGGENVYSFVQSLWLKI
tara:strand:+ start:2820 stop:3509 length:690 start_codon:yes stop_codon:yes gene_type:complete